MSGINPSVDNVSSHDVLPTNMAGGPTTPGDKYDDARHLKYGQAAPKKSDESNASSQQIRRYSASSDSKPVLIHTFQEEILSGWTGDDLIKMEEEREKQRKKNEQNKPNKRKKTM